MPSLKGRDPKVKGHTVYFHDDEFELIMVEANRRKLTISDYTSSCAYAPSRTNFPRHGNSLHQRSIEG